MTDTTKLTAMSKTKIIVKTLENPSLVFNPCDV